MYIAAMFKGYWGEPGYDIGRSKDIMAHLNFLMDMAYFNLNFTGRFNQWADSIGSSKTMIGVLNDYNSLDSACMIAAWQPPNGPKAGIMIYAANNLKSYTDSIFRSLVVPATDVDDNEKGIPVEYSLMQNYPNPFNPSTTIEYEIPASLTKDIHSENLSRRGTLVTLKIYDILGREISTLVNEEKTPGKYEVEWSAINYTSGLYFARLTVHSKEIKLYTKTIKMLMTK
jgi:hypothetical protein